MRRPIGEAWTGSARRAHCWNGKKGGPPKGNSACASSSRARASISRRLQRSSGWSSPSLASGEAANALQPLRPTKPASTIVRMSASSPTRSLSPRSKAPRGTRPDRSDGGERCHNIGALHAGRPASRRRGIVSTRMSSPIGSHTNHLASPRRHGAETPAPSESGAPAEAFIGRSLQRSRSRRVSRQRTHPRALASRPSACRAAFSVDVPRDRARRRERRPDASRTADRQPHEARAHRRMPRRGGDRLRRPQHWPLFRSIDRERQGVRALHRAHAARG